MLKLSWRAFNLGWLDIIDVIAETVEVANRCAAAQRLNLQFYLSVSSYSSVMVTHHRPVLSPWSWSFKLAGSPLGLNFLLLHKMGNFLWQRQCNNKSFEKVEVIYGVLNSAELTFVPHPVPLVLLWSLPLGRNYMWRSGCSVNKNKTKQTNSKIHGGEKKGSFFDQPWITVCHGRPALLLPSSEDFPPPPAAYEPVLRPAGPAAAPLGGAWLLLLLVALLLLKARCDSVKSRGREVTDNVALTNKKTRGEIDNCTETERERPQNND